MMPLQPRVISEDFSRSEHEGGTAKGPVGGVVRKQHRREADAVAAEAPPHLLRLVKIDLNDPACRLKTADFGAHRVGQRRIAGAETDDDCFRGLSEQAE